MLIALLKNGYKVMSSPRIHLRVPPVSQSVVPLRPDFVAGLEVFLPEDKHGASPLDRIASADAVVDKVGQPP